MERTLTMVKGLGAWMLFFAVFCGAAAALTVTATPPSLNVSPGMNHPVQIFYRGVEASPAGGTFSYSAFSSQGRFEIGAETLLGTVNTSQTLVLVNNRGTATESLVVPARIVKAALELGQGRIFFRRTFQPNDPDISPGSCEVQLQIVPASAGAFSVAQMELEFNRLASSGSTRSGSGGRLTVARNSRGLSATATV
ncbi:MAG: hypothetical protein JXB25_08985, partial [Deltaproteobacteria bacterium]|nr:hypothetical protein [Deltaproteobacteria bacterium]